MNEAIYCLRKHLHNARRQYVAGEGHLAHVGMYVFGPIQYTKIGENITSYTHRRSFGAYAATDTYTDSGTDIHTHTHKLKIHKKHHHNLHTTCIGSILQLTRFY